MGQLQPKQINKIQAGIIKIVGLSVTSTSTSIVVTSALTSAVAVAGQNNTSVPLVVSSNVTQAGIPVSTPQNRTDIWDSTSKQKIGATSAQFEVYGKITNSSSIWTLTFYYLDNSGTEQSYAFPSTLSIDFDFVYRFTFAQFPTDGLVSVVTKNVYQDTRGAGSVAILEPVSVTSTNTLANLTQSPTYPTKTILYVNGKAELAIDATPPFSVAGNVVTWSPSNAGYILETTDDVLAEYYI